MLTKVMLIQKRIYATLKANHLKPGLHCAVYSTFTPHFICCKYFNESFMDKNLLHISLTKFYKLKQKKKVHLFNNPKIKNKENIKA